MKNIRVSICAYSEGRTDPSQTAQGPNMDRVDGVMEMARMAHAEGADIAVFPEICALLGYDNALDCGEQLDGPVWSRVAACAQELGIFMAFNHPLKEADKLYNATALFNRQGKLEGYYAKAYPTHGELTTLHDESLHVNPGTGAVVFDTEIGRIGFATCFDLNFEQLCQDYAALTPDMILFSSMFAGGHLCDHWARETQSYFIGSVVGSGSRILNPLGRLQNEMRGIASQITQSINVDARVYHWDYNHRCMHNLRLRYGKDIEIEFSDEEGVFLVTACGETPLDVIEREIGLEPWRKYYNRASVDITAARHGNFPKQEKEGAW